MTWHYQMEGIWVACPTHDDDECCHLTGCLSSCVIEVLDTGMFLADYGGPESPSNEFPTLLEAKQFCEEKAKA